MSHAPAGCGGDGPAGTVGSISCSSTDFAKLSAELLGAGTTVRFEAHGASMAPLVRDGDVLAVRPADPGSIRLGDLVLVTDEHGRPLVHRVIRRTTGREGIRFTVQGDQVSRPDGVIPAAQVYGRVTTIERAGACIEVNRPSLRVLGWAAALRSRWNLRRGHGGRHAYRLAAGWVRKLPAFSKYLA